MKCVLFKNVELFSLALEMSSNDGSHGARDDAYRYQQHDISRPPQLLQQAQQQQQQQHLHLADGGISQMPGHQMMWSPNHHAMMPPPPPPQQFMHQNAAHLPTAAHLAAAQQQQHQQQRQHQHRYNDFMFNMPAYVQPPGQPETYSVLPVGHGNFLKIYHCNDALNSTGANSPELGGGSIYAHQQQQTQAQQQTVHQQQQQQQHFQAANSNFNMPPRIQQQQQQQQLARSQQQYSQNRGRTTSPMAATTTTTTTPTQPQQQSQIYNSYELFSSNPLLPAACDTKLTVSPQPQQITQPLQRPQKQKQPTSININSNEQPCLLSETNEDNTVAVTTTNMIINKLVNNWSPNLTGVAYTQFTVPTPPPPAAQEDAQTTQQNDSFLVENKQQAQLATTKFNDHEIVTNIEQVEQPQQQQQQQIEEKVDFEQTTTIQSEVAPILATTIAPIKPIISATTTVVKNNNIMPEVKKQRIVAEVKPMRMTYSDVVLSKVTYAQQQQQQIANQTAMLRNGNKPMGTATQMLYNERNKINNNATTTTTTASTANITVTTTTTTTPANSANKRGNASFNEEIRSANKKSPIHEQKEATSATIIASPVPTTATTNKTKRNSAGQTKLNTTKVVNNNKTTIMNENNGNNTVTLNGNSNNNNLNTKKRNNANTSATKDVSNHSLNKKATLSATTTTNTANINSNNNTNSNLEKESAYYERVPRKSSNATATTTTTKSTSNCNTNNIQANLNSNNSSSMPQTTTTSSYTKTRYSSTNNLNNSSSYSYSTTKRQRSSYNATSGITSFYNSATTTSNRNYALAKKVLSTWCEYMLKILMWLFYLVYDIVVIGCSMAFDSLKQNALSAWTQLRQLRTEFKQNSNKPTLWLRNSWRRFDARFGKNSRWAFWRRFYTKKPPPVTTQETFRSGRLPQTGEEAMYSLLNCKGKNAYSILGVPPDSSQEQIRKHYKKIAVLVHPDKNKQAGAEEAFKVLQRAFELIGEPENRLSYDQSLAEALHAEKAWTEFHDLLSQLHTKITEAANTIRSLLIC